MLKEIHRAANVKCFGLIFSSHPPILTTVGPHLAATLHQLGVTFSGPRQRMIEYELCGPVCHWHCIQLPLALYAALTHSRNQGEPLNAWAEKHDVRFLIPHLRTRGTGRPEISLQKCGFWKRFHVLHMGRSWMNANRKWITAPHKLVNVIVSSPAQ